MDHKQLPSRTAIAAFRSVDVSSSSAEGLGDGLAPGAAMASVALVLESLVFGGAGVSSVTLLAVVFPPGRESVAEEGLASCLIGSSSVAEVDSGGIETGEEDGVTLVAPSSSPSPPLPPPDPLSSPSLTGISSVASVDTVPLPDSLEGTPVGTVVPSVAEIVTLSVSGSDR